MADRRVASSLLVLPGAICQTSFIPATRTTSSLPVILLKIIADRLGVGRIDRRAKRLIILATSASHLAASRKGEFITM